MSTTTQPAYLVDTVDVGPEHRITVAYERGCSQARPGNGGTRWMPYPNQGVAEAEAVVLAQRMTAKHSLYDTGFSGTKFVIDGPRRPQDTKPVLDGLIEMLNRYDGLLYTGCDINTTNEDMAYVSAHSPYVLNSLSNSAVDTSLATGSGVFAAARAVLERPGRRLVPRVAVHGLGKVGSQVAQAASLAGWYVAGFDLDPRKDADGAATRVSEDILFETPCDVMVFCSISGVVTSEIAGRVAARWIVSAANAPLADASVNELLRRRGIHYLPDVVANSGAVLCDAVEWRHPERFATLDQYAIDHYVSRRISSLTHASIAQAELLGHPVEEVTAERLTTSR